MAFLRLIHITDLHFGSSFSPPWLRAQTVARVPGLGEHSELVARQLDLAIKMIQAAGPGIPTKVVMTGDLTTWGNSAEFTLALSYLRGRFYAGPPNVLVGLNDPALPVIPGNHDVWGGWLLGVSPHAGNPPATRSAYAFAFGCPAPGAHYPPGLTFPYQLRLLAGPPFNVYLYGLESNEVHLAPRPAVRNLLAQGFVGSGKLAALQALVAQEQGGPSIRIAALHHPLVHPNPHIPPQTHGLLNAATVAATLQKLDFSLALAGHLHHGYVQPVQPPTARPLYVLAAGTATQAVVLTGLEKQLLRRSYASLPSQAIQERWKMAALKCNEFRTYEFDHEQAAPSKVSVTVERYRYDPNLLFFGRQLVRNFYL